jgi:uncharacterized protein (DUF2252 family)
MLSRNHEFLGNAFMGIVAANRTYEAWLTKQLRGGMVSGDLDRKHAKMSESPFSFLRATYWRWAEKILEVCPDLAGAPPVLAVGDIHLENFGTWRDQEGRVVWGVNDYDEAAEMPYLLDVVRLATSAVLGSTRDQLSLKETVPACSTAIAAASTRRRRLFSTAGICGFAHALSSAKRTEASSGRR